MRRFFQVLHSEIRGLHEAAYLLGLFALLSQLLGLVRDRLLAGSFGAGDTLDVYYAAFKFPDLVFVGIASVVSIYVLIPFLSERAGSREAERRFVDDIFTVFFVVIATVSVVLFFAASHLCELFFPGLAARGLIDEVVLLTRILLLQPILLGLSNLLGSIIQTRQRFLIYAVSPLLYNIGIIMGILVFYPRFGLVGLGAGVLLGAFLHLLIQLPFILEERLFPRPSFSIDWKTVGKVISLSLPRALALSAHHVALLFVVGLASVIATGAISLFQLAYNLQAVPLSIIGVSYSVAAFPTLARLFSDGRRTQFLEQMVTATRHILFWSLPIMALFFVLRAQVVRVILGVGAFGWTETRLVAAALALFAVSLAAQNLSFLFVRGYYATGHTKKPLYINLFTALLVVVFSFGLVALFETSVLFREMMEALLRVSDIPGTVMLMLPLGYSLALIINAALLWIFFQRDFSHSFITVGATFMKSAIAAVVVGAISYLGLRLLDDVFNLDTFWGILLQGLLSGLAGIIVGIVVLSILKSEELPEAMGALRRKFWKTPALAPEAERLE